MTKRIPIGVNPPYDVIIAPGLLDEAGARLTGEIGPCRAAVICDSRVAGLYLDRLRQSLEAAGFEVFSYVFPAGEEQKNLGTLGEILEFLAESELTRKDCVVALGGGVCGDMAGFAAGCYMRGIKYIQMPTTLLSAVDSSVGGKTAVDLQAGKNLAGLFVQPAMVLCDTDCLKTLPPQALADGMAEAVKSGVLDGERLFALCEAETPDYPAIIAGCVRFKGRVVELDEKEQGLRKTLNLGHTPGHAIEKCSNFAISHGHAVAMGLSIMTRSAVTQGLCSAKDAERIINALEKAGLPTKTELSPAELAKAALADKKRAGSSITVVLPTGIGSCKLKPIPVTELEAVFKAGMEE